MKKFLLFILLLPLALCACSAKPADPYDMYAAALEALGAADSAQAETILRTEILMPGETEKLVFTTAASAAYEMRDGKMVSTMLMKHYWEDGTEAMRVQGWYIDGYYYRLAEEGAGGKLKYRPDMEDVQHEPGFPYVPYIAPSEIIESHMGGEAAELSFSLQADSIEILYWMYANVSPFVSSIKGIEVQSAKMAFTFDSMGRFATYFIRVECLVQAQSGATYEFVLQSDMQFLQYGGVQIDFPNDLDTYPGA